MITVRFGICDMSPDNIGASERGVFQPLDTVAFAAPPNDVMLFLFPQTKFDVPDGHLMYIVCNDPVDGVHVVLSSKVPAASE